MSKINLFFNHYKCESVQRQHEVDSCLVKNRIVFDRVIEVEGRPTFSELFAMSKDYPEDINCYCNSDIYFPDVSLLHKIKEGEFWVLSRYEFKKGILTHFNRSDSQDSFICRGMIKDIDANFYQGMWGSENSIVFKLNELGYHVTNPSLSIKTVHLHEVDKRDHVRTPLNTVPPPYMTVPPTIIKNL